MSTNQNILWMNLQKHKHPIIHSHFYALLIRTFMAGCSIKWGSQQVLNEEVWVSFSQRMIKQWAKIMSKWKTNTKKHTWKRPSVRRGKTDYSRIRVWKIGGIWEELEAPKTNKAGHSRLHDVEERVDGLGEAAGGGALLGLLEERLEGGGNLLEGYKRKQIVVSGNDREGE